MSIVTKVIDGRVYWIHQGGLTRIQAINEAAAWKRNSQRLTEGRKISGRRFYARAIRYEGQYAVFVRTEGRK
jgi:hypothetical protein